MVIKQDLLYDEYGDRLAKLRASLHDSKAKRDDFSCEKEVYNIGRVVLDESSNDSQRGQS